YCPAGRDSLAPFWRMRCTELATKSRHPEPPAGGGALAHRVVGRANRRHVCGGAGGSRRGDQRCLRNNSFKLTPPRYAAQFRREAATSFALEREHGDLQQLSGIAATRPIRNNCGGA